MSHQKQDPATAVSIPVSASTHFRAISDTGPPSLTICVPQPVETAPHGAHNISEESGARTGRTTTTGDSPGEQQGKYMEDVLLLVDVLQSSNHVTYECSV